MATNDAHPDSTDSSDAELFTFIVPPEAHKQRLDLFLSAALAPHCTVSRESIKKELLEHGCLVEQKSCTSPAFRVLSGQKIQFRMHLPENAVRPEEGDIVIIYRDEWLAVINKPAGLTVHPCPSCPEGTLVHRLVAHFPELRAMEGLRPGVVHRLDKDTSGLMVLALNEGARLALVADFAAHTVHKEYLALVHGVPAMQGDIREALGRHPTIKTRMAVVKQGKPAHSQWHVLYADPWQRFSLVRVRIFTGRTHQIRVHMAHIGHPLWGDSVYGSAASPALPFIARQMLHAYRLEFTHPNSGERLAFMCPPPDDFLHSARILNRRMARLVLTGAVGCGKSSLLSAFAARAIPVWSADAAVRQSYEAGNDGWHSLRARYGERFIPDVHSPVDRQALLAAMQDTRTRYEIESIIHPIIRYALERFWAEQEGAGQALAVAEVPLYCEARWKSDPEPFLVGVHCPLVVREQRLKEKRNWSAEQIATIEAWQWTEERKMQACALRVNNTGSLEALIHSAQAVLDAVEAKQAQEAQKIEEEFVKIWKC